MGGVGKGRGRVMEVAQYKHKGVRNKQRRETGSERSPVMAFPMKDRALCCSRPGTNQT